MTLAARIALVGTAVIVSVSAQTFEVASIKAVAGNGVVKQANGGSFWAGPRVKWSGSTLTLQNYSVKDLVKDAFNLRDEQVVGAEKPGSQRYLIVAKAPPHTTENEARRMTQSLLADRFHLQYHRETREFPSYALVVAKNGPKLTKAQERETSSEAVRFQVGRGHISQPLTMAGLAQILSARLGRPVADMTSLEGEFEITLDWTPDESEPDVLGGLPPKQRPAQDGAAPVADRPSIFVALQEQLGLRLETRRKTPVEVLVIDHVERSRE